jgi:sucrose-6-phosphate hydrolase SacC (GH32 family)
MQQIALIRTIAATSVLLAAVAASAKEAAARCDDILATANCLGKETLVDAPDGRMTLRFLVDRTSVEVFANDGMVSMTGCFLPKPSSHALELFADGGIATIKSMTVYELKSAWR